MKNAVEPTALSSLSDYLLKEGFSLLLGSLLIFSLKAWFSEAAFGYVDLQKNWKINAVILLNFLLLMYFKEFTQQVYIRLGLVLINIFIMLWSNNNICYYCHSKTMCDFLPNLCFWLFIWCFINENICNLIWHNNTYAVVAFQLWDFPLRTDDL